MEKVMMYNGFSIRMEPTRNSIAIDPEVALKAIGKSCGLYYEQQEDRDMRVVVSGLPECPALELQENISLHGSPCWDTVEVLTTDPKDIEAYQHFQAILAYVQEKVREK